MSVIDDNEYKVKKGDTWYKIARENGLSVEQLQAMNQDLDADQPLKIGETITLPSDGYDYTAQKGDTLTKIAEENGVRVQALFEANPKISKSGAISIGQKISIPSQYYAYTVKPGDTLHGIARDQSGGDINVNLLRRANPELSENGALSVGQKLRIPTGYYMHTMRSGETLYALQRQYGVSVEEFHDANPGLDQNNISVNQRIRIPSPSVQLASIIRPKPDAAPVVKKTKPAVKAKGATTKSFNKAGGLQAYNISSKATKKAWAEAKRGITHAPVSSGSNAKPLIVIDLGHGSKSKGGAHDQGAVSRDGTLTEAEIVDAVGSSLAKQLSDKGYQVAFTRNPGEVFLYEGGKGARLNRRAIYAVNLERELKSPYTVFVSLHVNSAAGNAGRGYEVKTPRARDNKRLNNNSEKLGKYVSTGMGRYHPSISRGVDEQSLGMFRKFGTQSYGNDAAILVELDFINNKAGQSRLENMKEKPYNIAAGIKHGIEQYVQEKSPGLKLDSSPQFKG